MQTHEKFTPSTTPTTHPEPPSPLGFFFLLADIWDLNTDQQIKLLGSPSRSTYFRWRKDGGEVSADTLERISHLDPSIRLCASSWIRRNLPSNGSEDPTGISKARPHWT